MYTVCEDHALLEVPEKPEVDRLTLIPVPVEDATAFPTNCKNELVLPVFCKSESVKVNTNCPDPLIAALVCVTDVSIEVVPNIVPVVYKATFVVLVNEYPELGVNTILKVCEDP
jgi:hypothetical protein